MIKRILSFILIHCILTTNCMDLIIFNQEQSPPKPVHPLRAQLYDAIRSDNEAQAIHILSQDFPLNEPGTQAEDDDPPLCVAARLGRSTILETMIANFNAVIDINDANGDTPAHNAACTGKIDVMRLLIRCNASLTAKNVWGQTPLHVALEARPLSYGLVALLVKKGAPLNEPDEDGNTACHLAFARNNNEILDLLDKYDSNWELENKDGQTPQDRRPLGKLIPNSPPPPIPQEEYTIEIDFYDAIGYWGTEKPVDPEEITSIFFVEESLIESESIKKLTTIYMLLDLVSGQEELVSVEEEDEEREEDLATDILFEEELETIDSSSEEFPFFY